MISRLHLARHEIDRVFGQGYGAAYPELVAAVMQSASSTNYGAGDLVRDRALISCGCGLDAMTSEFLLLATAGDGAELDPAMAMATSPPARIRPRMAFPLSQRSYARWSSGDIVL